MQNQARILIADDEPVVLELLRSVLEGSGFETVACRTAAEVRDALDQSKFEAIVADYRFPGLDAISLHRILAQKRDELARRLLVITGDVTDPALESFVNDTGTPVMGKPFDLGSLRRAVHEVLRRPRLRLPARR